MTDDQHERLRLLRPTARSFNSPDETFHGKRTLSGRLLICGLCGRPLKPQVYQQTVRMVCHKLNAGCGKVVIKHDPLEEFILDRVVAAVTKNERWTRRMSEQPAADRSALEERRRALNEQTERANDAYVQGFMKAAQFSETQARIQQEVADVERQLAGMYGQEALADRGTDWRAWSSLQRRNFLRQLIQHVEVAAWPAGTPTTINRRRGQTDEELAEARAEQMTAVLR